MFVDRFVVFCMNGCAFLTCMINHASVKMCGCLSSHEAFCGKNIFCVWWGGGGGRNQDLPNLAWWYPPVIFTFSCQFQWRPNFRVTGGIGKVFDKLCLVVIMFNPVQTSYSCYNVLYFQLVYRIPFIAMAVQDNCDIFGFSQVVKIKIYKKSISLFSFTWFNENLDGTLKFKN